MKVTGSSGLPPAAAGAKPAAAAAGFTLGDTAATTAPAAAARTLAAGPVGSTDALLALQAVDGPLERRRRAVKRAGRLLDALDEVKMALLDGESVAPALQRLAQAAREHRGGADDVQLDGVLDQIETRAAVELAKAEMSRVAA